jgi:HK97 gp10 family phage protein
VNVVIVGLPETMAKVAAIPVVCETFGQAGLEAGKELVAETAKQLVPKRTGALAASIRPVPEGVAVGERYAGFVEFGTRYMPAEAYLGPALESEAPQVSDLVSNTVRTALYAL